MFIVKYQNSVLTHLFSLSFSQSYLAWFWNLLEKALELPLVQFAGNITWAFCQQR